MTNLGAIFNELDNRVKVQNDLVILESLSQANKNIIELNLGLD